MTYKCIWIFVIWVMTYGVGAAQALTLVIPEVQVTPGDKDVALTLHIQDGQGIAGGDLVLTYDADFFVATDVQKSDLLRSAGIAVFHNFNTIGQVRISMAGVEGIESDNGVLIIVLFDVQPDVFENVSDLVLDARLRDTQGRVREAVVQAGSITVLSGQNPADFSGNGVVDFQDFILFAQHMNTIQGDSKYNAQFDLDGNGAVDFPDFLAFVKVFGQ